MKDVPPRNGRTCEATSEGVPPTGKIVPKWSDGCIQAEVEGLAPKERRTTRSKLEAAVGGSSVDLHDVYMYRYEDYEDNEEI